MNFKKILPVVFIATLLLAGCGQPDGPKAPGKYAETAKCLTQKGVIMYGAYWCPHCADQKAAFGDDFQFVKYQECDDAGTNGNHKACLEAGVTSYPTWFFPGQGNLVGGQPVYVLAKLANCDDKLPAEDQATLKANEVKAESTTTTPTTTGTTTTTPPTTTK